MANKREKLDRAQPTFRALDLGYGFTKYSKGHMGNDFVLDVSSFPSYAAPFDKLGFSATYLQNLDVIAVDVNGIKYCVGNESKMAATGQAGQIIGDTFFKSDQYLALARGAFSYMNIPENGVVDRITIGLPLNVFMDRDIQKHLRKVILGKHSIPDDGGTSTRDITVDDLILIPQVMGSLVALASPDGSMDQVSKDVNLTIDVGYGTLLWLTSQGLKPFINRSNGNMGGVSKLLQSALRPLGAKVMANIGTMDKVDKAILANAATVGIDGTQVDVEVLRSRMNSVISESLAELLSSVGDISDVDNVFITGGGAFLYREAICAAFPSRNIRCAVENSQFTNVRGFQILAQGNDLN